MKVLTTSQAAKLVRVSPRTVCKWCDSGRLRSYRIPGSQTRRIPLYCLEEFCKRNNTPAPSVDGPEE